MRQCYSTRVAPGRNGAVRLLDSTAGSRRAAVERRRHCAGRRRAYGPRPARWSSPVRPAGRRGSPRALASWRRLGATRGVVATQAAATSRSRPSPPRADVRGSATRWALADTSRALAQATGRRTVVARDDVHLLDDGPRRWSATWWRAAPPRCLHAAHGEALPGPVAASSRPTGGPTGRFACAAAAEAVAAVLAAVGRDRGGQSRRASRRFGPAPGATAALRRLVDDARRCGALRRPGPLWRLPRLVARRGGRALRAGGRLPAASATWRRARIAEPLEVGVLEAVFAAPG